MSLMSVLRDALDRRELSVGDLIRFAAVVEKLTIIIFASVLAEVFSRYAGKCVNVDELRSVLEEVVYDNLNELIELHKVPIAIYFSKIHVR